MNNSLGNNHLGFEGILNFCHELQKLDPFEGCQGFKFLAPEMQ
jgi:hypothetical protein